MHTHSSRVNNQRGEVNSGDVCAAKLMVSSRMPTALETTNTQLQGDLATMGAP